MKTQTVIENMKVNNNSQKVNYNIHDVLHAAETSMLLNIRVEHMCSTRTGVEVANQLVISWETTPQVFGNSPLGVRVFFSYGVKIAVVAGNEVILDSNPRNYTRTTCKYLTQFLGANDKERAKKIQSGEYQVADLN